VDIDGDVTIEGNNVMLYGQGPDVIDGIAIGEPRKGC
jgi:hypothetical protein